MEETLMGVVDHAREAGWELISNMRFHGMFPSETEADGILVTAVGPRVKEWMKQWEHCPTVHISQPAPELHYPWVGVDYERAGRDGARHLLELGHVHHAFYWLQENHEVMSIRDAFVKEIESAGLPVHFLDFPKAFGGRELNDIPREERLRWLAGEIGKLKKPLAVMGDDDRRSLELIAVCELAGLSVPEDVAILGCENRNVEVGLSHIPLSSVDVNWPRVGREAAVMLESLMDGQVPRQHGIKVPTRGVVARASTATFVTESEGVSRALLHVRKHFPQPLRMTELSRMAGMSERKFREEFKRLVGRSPKAEILRARLASSARLLRDTDLKLDAIAVESGFGTAKKLCEVFAETRGMTPTEWRQQASRS